MLNARVWLVCVAAACGAAQTPSSPSQSLTLEAALRLTLQHNLRIQIQDEQIAARRGAVQEAAGRFDWNWIGDGTTGRSYRPLTAYEAFQFSLFNGFQTTSSAINSSRLNFGAVQQFRNGVSVSPTIAATRLTDNLANRIGINQGQAQITATIPLLRGRGRDVVTAPEREVGRLLDASTADRNALISNLLATTANAYWNVVAAERSLSVARAAEQQAETMIVNTSALIDAGRLPRSDLHQATAHEAQRAAERISAEQVVLDNRAQLALAIGLGVTDAASLPGVLDPLPPALDPENAPSGSRAAQAYVQLALERRPEFRAQQMRQDASRISRTAALDSLKPQLNVIVSTGFSGLYEGTRADRYLLSPVHSLRGIDVSAGVSYRFAPARRTASGIAEQATAAVRQADLEYQDLARRAAAEVAPALSGVLSAVQQLGRVRASVEASRNALDAERERLRMGAGSVINTITVEDRLILALQSEVHAELACAQALVRLRLVTGTIVGSDSPVSTVDASVFRTAPALPRPPAERSPQ